MDISPIALFAYKRLWHLQKTIQSLKNNIMADASELYIFSDGPRSDGDAQKVSSVRDYIRTITGFRKINIIERKNNMGLSRSIISGVSEIVKKYGRIIVLEDDMLTSPYFIQFMNESLQWYMNEEKVICAHGYIYPVKTRLPETFFLKGADCWGWATWERGWDLFESDAEMLLKEIKKKELQKDFDLRGAYPYTKMLKDLIKGKNESWAVQWRASAFIKNKLYLQSGRPLIYNIGNDNSGTHGGSSEIFGTALTCDPISLQKVVIQENTVALSEIEKYLKSSRQSLFNKAIKRLFINNHSG